MTALRAATAKRIHRWSSYYQTTAATRTWCRRRRTLERKTSRENPDAETAHSSISCKDASFGPVADLFNQKVEGTAWNAKPSWYVLATQDQTVPRICNILSRNG